MHRADTEMNYYKLLFHGLTHTSSHQSCNLKLCFYIHGARYLQSDSAPYVTLHGDMWLHSWLRYCATNWKVAGSNPGGAIGIFH